MADQQAGGESAVPQEPDKRPLNEQWLARLKANRVVAILLVAAAIVAGLASITDAAGKLIAVFHRQSPEDARQALARLSVPFTANDFSAAAGKGDLVATKLFLAAGMKPDELPSAETPTALVAAVSKDRPEVVAALLKAGADPALHANGLHSPFEVAAIHGNVPIATTLLASKRVPGKEIDSAFLLAAEEGNPEMLPFLKAQGADVARQSTPALIEAASATRVDGKRMADTVAFLLQAGANIEARSGDSDWTPLTSAVYHSQPAVVGVLLDHGAVVDVRDRDQRTPLWWAAGVGHVDAAALLLAKGADANAKDNEGMTPLGRAKYNLAEPMAQLLRAHGAK